MISDNNTAKPPASVNGYQGPTIPDLRKDQDLSAFVRSEVQRMISTQLPSLQKSVANTQQQDQHLLQQQQADVQQQLADFRAQQKKQMDEFVSCQEQQFLALQQQLGAPPTTRLHAAPAPAFNTIRSAPAPAPVTSGQSDHPFGKFWLVNGTKIGLVQSTSYAGICKVAMLV